MVIRYGNYALDESNNILITGWREMHGAERDIVMLGTAGVRGTKVLNDTFEAKVNELVGAIECEDELDDQVRAFVTAMSKKGEPLTIEDDDGTVYSYDGAYVTNTSDMIEMRTLRRKKIVKFRLLFLCPKGFARDTTQLTHSFDTITTVPYESSLNILGDTNPEPVIEVTINTASGVEEIIFTNTTTNQQISVSDITFANGDMLVFNTSTKQVLLNSLSITFEGVFPDFVVGENNFQLTATGSTSIQVNQNQYNSNTSIFGNNHVAQSFEVGSNLDIEQIGLVINKVGTEVMGEYDYFTDNSIDGDKWDTSGLVIENGNQLRFYMQQSGGGRTSTADTDNKTPAGFPPGDPVVGTEFYFARSGSHGNGGTMRVRLTNGTAYIEVAQLLDVGDTIIRLGGKFGSGDSTRWASAGGTFSMLNVGSNIEVRENGTLRLTISGVNMLAGDNLFLEAHATAGNYDDGSTIYGILDTVRFQQASSANTDITVRIETDSTGDPSGTIVTNGSLTIPASEIGTSFSEILKTFSTPPSLTASTTYHVVVYQTGGDVNNYYQLKKQNTNVLADGNLETSIDAGSNWTQVTGEDLYLRLWSTLPTGFDIDMDIKYFPSYYTVGE
jgi:hypothetical protein